MSETKRPPPLWIIILVAFLVSSTVSVVVITWTMPRPQQPLQRTEGVMTYMFCWQCPKVGGVEYCTVPCKEAGR